MGKWSIRTANWIVHGGVWLSCLFLIIFWGRIPEKIVTHYNGAGAADGWGNKGSLILIVVLMFYIYAMHLICMRVVSRLTTKEKMYGKKLAAFVTEEDMAAGNRLTMAYLAWTDASMIVMLDYIIVSSAFGRPLGGGFVWVLFPAIGGELVWYLVCCFRKKRQIRMRVLAELAAKEGESSGTPDDM